MLDVSFYGVRGSTPCSGPAVVGHGGNTSCVVVEVPGEAPIICDLGTGVRYFGMGCDPGQPFRATALVTHLHWDHIQGLPFFGPVLRADSVLDLVGPPQETGTFEEALAGAVRPPVFPIPLAELPGDVRVREMSTGCFPVGSALITAFPVPHIGPTNGYRIEAGGVSVAYVSDLQQPVDGSNRVWADVAERCRGVDVLIHDAQYDADEFALKSTWGHCTVAYAVEMARVAEVGCLVLYHHDPLHDDVWIDRAVEAARRAAGGAFEVEAAREGLVLRLGDRSGA